MAAESQEFLDPQRDMKPAPLDERITPYNAILLNSNPFNHLVAQEPTFMFELEWRLRNRGVEAIIAD